MKIEMGNFPSRTGEMNRVMEIHIDPWDTWSLDVTLAHIIVPCLQQLRNEFHGCGFVENEDVPKHLHSEFDCIEDAYLNGVDEHWFARWEWVLDEMIWGFTRIRDGLEHCENGEEAARIQNCCRLFGKYYRGLWD